ncbi:MAG: GAF and ANTAR domain-containing protein, partial [Ilumatobacteraceae bacterium]
MTEVNRNLRVARESLVVETMVQLADTLIDDYDVIEFLGMLSERCVSLVDADEVGIMVTDGHGNLQVVASSTERTRLLELYELQNRDGPCFEAFTTGLPVSSADLAAEHGRWSTFSTQALSVGFRSVHSIPMRLRADSVGALSLLRAAPGLMHEADLALVGALARMATIGLLQERAVHASRLASAQLQSALSSRIRIEQAKGVIAERHGVDIDTAFERLRTYARN